MGSGLCPYTAGKKPALSASVINGVPGASAPVTTSGFPRPGPEISALEGPFAAAVAGTASATRATIRTRFIDASTPATGVRFPTCR